MKPSNAMNRNWAKVMMLPHPGNSLYNKATEDIWLICMWQDLTYDIFWVITPKAWDFLHWCLVWIDLQTKNIWLCFATWESEITSLVYSVTEKTSKKLIPGLIRTKCIFFRSSSSKAWLSVNSKRGVYCCRKFADWPDKKLQKHNIATASEKNESDGKSGAHVGCLLAWESAEGSSLHRHSFYLTHLCKYPTVIVSTKKRYQLISTGTNFSFEHVLGRAFPRFLNGNAWAFGSRSSVSSFFENVFHAVKNMKLCLFKHYFNKYRMSFKNKQIKKNPLYSAYRK